MIIVKIHYGLGNQLFQYAFSRAIGFEKKLNVGLDISFFKTQDENEKHPRLYLLNQFNIVENYIDEDICAKYTKPDFFERRIRNLQQLISPYYKQKLVREKQLDYDANICKISNNCYLFGYWQDLRYFSKYEDIIRKELSFKSIPDSLNQKWLDRINACNSVCIHIRRGDYLTDGTTFSSAGVCNIDYYYRAVEVIAGQVSDPVYFVFSDDTSWVQSNFKLPSECYYVNHNSEALAAEDLRLMQACRHHILSNSTFSWWGAWLSGNKDGIVITPKVWRKNGPQMFLPDYWNKI